MGGVARAIYKVRGWVCKWGGWTVINSAVELSAALTLLATGTPTPVRRCRSDAAPTALGGELPYAFAKTRCAVVWEKLEAIVGQLRRTSAALDRINALRDQPWVVATETTRHMMLIFQGGGKLLVTVNGDVHYGRYEVIEGAGSVLLDLDGKPRLYKHGFIDDALMVLKLQGHGFEPLVLVNEAKVPDLDVEGYLERVYLGPGRERAELEERKREAIRTGVPTAHRNGRVIGNWQGKVVRSHGANPTGMQHYMPGQSISLDGEVAPDGFYDVPGLSDVFRVQEGVIKELYYRDDYKQEDGQLVRIFGSRTGGINPGCPVLRSGVPAPDGRYSTGWFSSVEVKDGVVV